MADIDVVLCMSCGNIWGLQGTSNERTCPVCDSGDFQRLEVVEL